MGTLSKPYAALRRALGFPLPSHLTPSQMLPPFFDASPVTACLTRGQRQRWTEAPRVKGALGAKTRSSSNISTEGASGATARQREGR